NAILDDVTMSITGGDAEIASVAFPATVRQGTKIALAWTTHNYGPGTLEGILTSAWLSKDKAPGNGEFGENFIASESTSSLPAGMSESEYRSFTVPVALESGRYNLILVTDPNNVFDESVSPVGETNNTF